ncbi:MAG: hypothetical protein WC061_10045 [Melioribacteraceae bacterium]
MIVFLLVLILVFIGVDLLVRFVIDPMLAASNKKNKTAKSYTRVYDPSINFAIETMYDGGKPHNPEEPVNPGGDTSLSKDTNANSKQ